MKSRTLAATAAIAGLAGLGLAVAVSSPAQAATYHRPHISACSRVAVTMNTDAVLYQNGHTPLDVIITAPSGQRLGASTGAVQAVDPDGGAHSLANITRVSPREIEARGTIPASSVPGNWAIDAAVTYVKTSDTSSRTQTCLATTNVRVRKATYLYRPTVTRDGDTVNLTGKWTALNAAGTAYVGGRNHSVRIQYKPYNATTYTWGSWTNVDTVTTDTGGVISDSLQHFPGAGDIRTYYAGNSVDSGPSTSNVAYIAGS